MNAAIPPMPHATVDTRLDAPQALMLAEEAIGHPVPLMTNFGLSKVAGEVTGRHPTGFTYKTSVGPLLKFKLNDGYVVAQDNGQGTRISFHESKRSTIVYAILMGVMVVLVIANYFLLIHQSRPAVPMGYGGMGYPVQPPSSGFPVWLYIILAIAAIGATAYQMYEVVMAPKKAIQYFTMRANGGMPAPQAGFPGQPAGGFPPQAGGFPPQAGGFPPQPQQGGFPPQAQPAGLPPAQPAGFPPQPQASGVPPQADAAPPPVAPPQPMPAAPAASAADEKQRQLAELRAGGIITAEDYDRAAAAIEAKR